MWLLATSLGDRSSKLADFNTEPKPADALWLLWRYLEREGSLWRWSGSRQSEYLAWRSVVILDPVSKVKIFEAISIQAKSPPGFLFESQSMNHPPINLVRAFTLWCFTQSVLGNFLVLCESTKNLGTDKKYNVTRQIMTSLTYINFGALEIFAVAQVSSFESTEGADGAKLPRLAKRFWQLEKPQKLLLGDVSFPDQTKSEEDEDFLLGDMSFPDHDTSEENES